jgi:CheY-like chemotaxis protein
MTTVQTMQSNRLSGKNILIVEDEPLLAHDYEECIRGCGASIVGPFSTTRDALGALAVSPIEVDIALVDHALRDGPSVELQQRLRSLGIPFVVLTGYPRVLVRDAENKENLLSKPVTSVELCEALGNICR